VPSSNYDKEKSNGASWSARLVGRRKAKKSQNVRSIVTRRLIREDQTALLRPQKAGSNGLNPGTGNATTRTEEGQGHSCERTFKERRDYKQHKYDEGKEVNVGYRGRERK